MAGKKGMKQGGFVVLDGEDQGEDWYPKTKREYY